MHPADVIYAHFARNPPATAPYLFFTIQPAIDDLSSANTLVLIGDVREG